MFKKSVSTSYHMQQLGVMMTQKTIRMGKISLVSQWHSLVILQKHLLKVSPRFLAMFQHLVHKMVYQVVKHMTLFLHLVN